MSIQTKWQDKPMIMSLGSPDVWQNLATSWYSCNLKLSLLLFQSCLCKAVNCRSLTWQFWMGWHSILFLHNLWNINNTPSSLRGKFKMSSNTYMNAECLLRARGGFFKNIFWWVTFMFLCISKVTKRQTGFMRWARSGLWATYWEHLIMVYAPI